MEEEKQVRDSLLDSMEEEDNDVECLFLDFIQLEKSLSNKENNIFCFFEGKDYQYYCQRIRTYLEEMEKVNPISCNGKSSVIALNKMIREQTKIGNKRLLFFVDRDFDDNSKLDSSIYVTPCYAIENFYIKDWVIQDFLCAELDIKLSNQNDRIEYEKAFKYFKEEREKFIEDIALLNTWYSLQRKKRFYRIDHPNLDKLKERKKLPDNITIEILKENTENYIEVDNGEIELERSRLMIDPLNLFRGKYYLEFLQDIIEFLTSNKAKDTGIFRKRRKINYTIGRKNLVSLLSQYAETPNCLKAYIKNGLTCKTEEVAS